MLQSLDTLIAFVVILLTASLLVTILVQMLSALFALRGKNLGNALALTFQHIDPQLSADAYKLAQRILSDPLLSDSAATTKSLHGLVPADRQNPWTMLSLFAGMKMASAIRPEEVHDMLIKIGRGNDPLAGVARHLLAKIRAADSPLATTANNVTAILDIANNLADPATKAALTTAIDATQNSLQTMAIHITGEIDTLARSFKSAQDRAQQWFLMHTRIFTVVCGILLAFLLQLDTVEIFKFVSTNAVARTALAGSADKLVEKADGILEKNGSLLDYIYDEAKKAMPVIALTAGQRKAATNTTALRDAIKNDTAHQVPDDFDQKFAAAEKTAMESYYKDRRAQMEDLTKGVAATGFDLLPQTPLQRWGGYWNSFCAHFWGMAITAGLLSLGAPYWFNLLKNLTSLRPAVAQLIGREQEGNNR